MSAIDINSWMTSLLDQLQSSRQRQLVAFCGPRAWCDKQLEVFAGLEESLQVLSNRNLAVATTAFSKADSCLGSEARLVVLDLFDGFNPDVLCIAGGLVRAGGVLIVLSPDIEDWDMREDRYARWQDQSYSSRPIFAEYFFNALKMDSEIGVLLTPGVEFIAMNSLPVLRPTPVEQGRTAEQSRILQQIEPWLESGKSGIALIDADRGRGKSTCLGLLAKRLQSRLKILVSANSRQTAAPLLQIATDVEFVAPDRLLQSNPEADLLIIDEAAMIPQSLLRQMIRLYTQVVMATTNGGYEGTGQGFMLSFVADLEQHKLQRFYLERPVRWCQDDRLEAWLNRTLILKPAIPPPAARIETQSRCELQLIVEPGSAEYLPLLLQVYGLLNSAHYRTRPSDLRMLMENPDLVLIVAREAELVVGALLLNIEGGLDDELCEEIFLGRRRPRGHLLAQMLTAQAGLKKFAKYRGLRVQRIAVAETHRRQGLGTALIEYALDYGREKSLTYLGASFALDPETANFWRHLKFNLVHVSFAQGKSSGNNSIAVLMPIAGELHQEIGLLQQRIQTQLATWMTQFLQTMDAGQVVTLLRFAGYHATMNDFERHEIEAFAGGNKGFELCFASLQKYVMHCIAQLPIEPDGLLIEKAVQNRSWVLLERESGAQGRKQLQQRLRGLVDALIKAC